jgi:hypothetical protein
LDKIKEVVLKKQLSLLGDRTFIVNPAADRASQPRKKPINAGEIIDIRILAESIFKKGMLCNIENWGKRE